MLSLKVNVLRSTHEWSVILINHKNVSDVSYLKFYFISTSLQNYGEAHNNLYIIYKFLFFC